ncbi:ester cyclase [Martelella sp. HB161492]|uniref:ester cyclase n=1 Tax=Martelella sp. HB161492 TaxID=2720726 RepID=UPI0015901169|nr:ester cyclase [Martelella sp. HB161492]
MRKLTSLLAAAAISLPLATAASAQQTTTPQDANAAIPALMTELSKYQSAEETTKKNLETFDTLDFDVYTHQKWDRLHESHAQDILVHYPDGTTTKGLDAHIEALKPMFVFAPDTRIESHPVKFGDGEWTGVIGVLEGTFTEPMPVGDGKTLDPTGKPFKLTMATLGHWNSDGVMDEEYLFWDNLDFMKQIGLAQ